MAVKTTGSKPAASAEGENRKLQFLVTSFTAVPGFKDIGIQAINNKGQAVGAAKKTVGQGLFHAFLFSHGKSEDLGSLGGSSIAIAINDVGDVAGDAQTPDGLTHAFLWRKGRMKDLGEIGRSGGNVIGLNNHDQVIGSIGKLHGHEHSFLYSHGRLEDLGASFTVLAINDAGQILGLSGGRLCLRNGKRTKPLPIPSKGLDLFDAVVMNNAGQVAYTVGDSFAFGHAWLYSHGHQIDLGKLIPHASSRVHAINNRGQVVGALPSPGEDWGALLWKNGKVYVLGDPEDVCLFPNLPKGVFLTSASYINDNGQIIVTGQSDKLAIDSNGDETVEYFSFLLTPKK